MLGGQPLALVQHVVDFTVGDSPANLRTLALVSSAWSQDILNLVCARSLRRYTIVLPDRERRLASCGALLDLRHQLTLQRTHLRELYVNVSDATAVSTNTWSSVLAAAPFIERLEIRAPDALDSLAAVLCVATQFCPRVRSLEIHQLCLCDSGTVAKVVLPALLEAYAQLKKYGGLRELKEEIPFGRMQDKAALATRYVQALVGNCPNLEVVNTFDSRAHRMPAYANVQWHIGLDTWEAFCRSCTKLKVFEWSIVPFATAFFEMFGNYPKPKLEKLTLAVCRIFKWDWDAYDRQYGRLDSGFGVFARHHEAILAACPALRDLNVFCPPLRVFGRDRRPTPGYHGDAFCETLTTCCRRLERFLFVMDDQMELKTFTDNAMYALATLPALTSVELRFVNITGHGLFQLVVNAYRTEWTPQRNYVIAAGEDRDVWLFFDVVKVFLADILAWGRSGFQSDDESDSESLPCTSDRVLLRLRNRCPFPVEPSEGIQACLALCTAVARRYPQLRLRLVGYGPRMGDANNNSTRKIDVIEEFDFYTAATKLPDSDVTWAHPNDVQIDDICVSRWR